MAGDRREGRLTLFESRLIVARFLTVCKLLSPAALAGGLTIRLKVVEITRGDPRLDYPKQTLTLAAGVLPPLFSSPLKYH
jgi:hypothetical protein